MANLTTSADLLAQLLRNAGEEASNLSPLYSKGLEYLNTAHVSVLSGHSEFNLGIGEPFPWAIEEDPISLTLKPAVEEGTISLTNGSTSGTFSSAPADSLVDYYLKVGDEEEMYKIATHTAGNTAFTLKRAFIGATLATYGFKAIKLEYDLGSEVLRLVAPMMGFKKNKDGVRYQVFGMDYMLFRNEFPLRDIGQAFPSRFSVRFESEDSFVVMFNAYPSEEEILDIPYVKKPDSLTDSAGSFPRIPLQHREVLSYIGAAKMLIQDKKDQESGRAMLEFARNKLESMSKQWSKSKTNYGTNWGRLIPRSSGRV